VVEGSAENPDLRYESFDFIVLRLVLEHVVDPVVALGQLRKLLRPGGRIAVISNDFAFHLRTWPEVGELDDLYDAYIASRRSDGGDPCIGRRVPDLLRKAGYRLAGFEIEATHNHLIGDPAFLLAEGAGIPAQLVESGYLEEDVFQRLVASWKGMLEHPDHTIMRPLFVAVGENSEEIELPSWDELSIAKAADAVGELDYIAPTTQLERDIAQIFAEVIGLERVGVNQNFFDLGGTSLMLEHAQVRLESLLEDELPLTFLFRHPTVGALAAGLEVNAGSNPGEKQSNTGDAPPDLDGRPPSRVAASETVSRQAQRRRDALFRRRSTNE
jgi:SAM-dependent methyltransferase